MRVETIGSAKRTTAIYALCEYPSMAPRYIGKTVLYLHERHKAHIRDAKKGSSLPVHRWLRKQIKAGRRLAISLIEYVPPNADWASRERHWIKVTRNSGAKLLNITDGGEGLPGHVFSDEHRKNIAASLRTGAEFDCLNCGESFWRKKNEIEKGENKYCSRKCYQKAQIGKPKAGAKFPQSAIDAAAKFKREKKLCKRGHPLSGSNLFVNNKGSRGCKECRKLHKAKYLAGKK